jgi:hypothetical protein
LVAYKATYFCIKFSLFGVDERLKISFLFQLMMQKRDIVLTAVFSSLAALILLLLPQARRRRSLSGRQQQPTRSRP